MMTHRLATLSLALALAWATPSSALAAEGGARPSATTIDPRAYGRFVGDVVTREFTLDLPAGWRLDEATLPRPGGRSSAIELRAIERLGPNRWRLEHQVMLAPRQHRTLELPGFTLRATRGDKEEAAIRIEPWPLLVAPLLPDEPPERAGLGALQPDAAPPPLPTTGLERRLAWTGLAGLGLSALLAAHLLAPRWALHRRRPFALALRELQRLPARLNDDETARRAFTTVHTALDRAAGQVLHPADLPAFLARRPAFVPLRDELQAFLTASRELFFGGRLPAGFDDVERLRRLCRAGHEAEGSVPAAPTADRR